MRTPTAQEVFDTAVGGVLRQGRPSVTEDGLCCYQDADGMKCAIGHLIPEAVFKRWGARIGHLDIHDVPEATLPHGIDLRPHMKPGPGGYVLLHELRKAHDEALGDEMGIPQPPPADFLAEFGRRCRFIAEVFGLSTAVLDTPLPA
jgi:hypothetical protein